MIRLRPKYYVETRFEKTVKYPSRTVEYHFNQPVEYCNGKSYWDYPEDDTVRQNFHNYKWESQWYNECLTISRYTEGIWASDDIRDKAFEKIFTTKSDGDGVFVPLKDFEIYLLNLGYEMISFDKMCSQTPGFNILCDKMDGNRLYGARGVYYTRVYRKNNKYLCFAFGVKYGKLPMCNFYFTNSERSDDTFQVPTDKNIFQLAEKGLIQSLQEISRKYD